MTALILIDMLNDYFRNGPLAEQRSQLTENINHLIAYARVNNFPVIWVRQEFRPDLSDAFADMRKRNVRVTIAGTDGCRILSELGRQANDHEIVKKRYSAFYGTSLDDLLSSLNVQTLIIAGINTHACVRTAAVDAYQRDLDVIVVRECVASYDSEHHDVTLRYLGRAIAEVKALAEVVGSKSD